MKHICLIFVLSLFSVAVFAGEKCELTLSSAPALFNLKLGMSGTEAKNAVGGKLNIKNKKEGVFFKNFIKRSPPRNLDGVRAVYLRFFDSKIYQIEIFYKSLYKDREIHEFVRYFSAENDLNIDLWQIKNGIAKLECSGFSIISDNYLNLRVQITDDEQLAAFKESKSK